VLVKKTGASQKATATLNCRARTSVLSFKQIRQFLTVQEQVDLFGAWAGRSPTAEVLTSYALTAFRFSQRKPERIAAGLDRLAATRPAGVGLPRLPALAARQVDTAPQPL